MKSSQEKIKYATEWASRNLDKVRKYKSDWKKRNRDSINTRIKERRKEEPSYRLRCNISKTVWEYLTKQHKIKDSATWLKLPYTPKDLKEHLESLFDDKMTWDNYGKYWNIDHIIPQSKLLYDSMEHSNFYECWKLENLRPMIVIENIRKSNK